MAASVVTVAQRKGGAGKTTLAIQLAVTWSVAGRRVALVDVDPQGSLAAWARLRAERPGSNPRSPTVTAVGGWRAQNEIEKLARDHDIVLVDSAPHAETEARIAVRAANLVLIPIQPSVMDLWATEATIKLASTEKRPALLVLNRVPARSKAAAQVIEAAAGLGVPVALSTLGNRTGLAASIAAGAGVAELEPEGTAAQEVAALAAEVMKRLGR